MNAILQPDFFRQGVEPNDLPDHIIRSCQKSHQALNLAITSSGLEHQHLWKPLSIDKGSWSKITNGQAHFPNDKLASFCKLVNNNIYLRWLNMQCEHECRPIKSTLEQELAAEREKNAQLERDLNLLKECLRK